MSSFEPSWKPARPRDAGPTGGDARASDDRVEVARMVLLGVMIGDAALFIIVALMMAQPGLGLVLAFALLFAAPSVVAAVAVRTGEGLDRAIFAVVVAWLVAVLLPMAASLIDGLGWSSGPVRRDWMLLKLSLPIAALQMLAPAAVRWARRGGNFLATFGVMVAVLLVVLVALGRDLFPGLG